MPNKQKTVRTDDKVELVLGVTLEHKAAELHDKVYWESWQSKFTYILVI